MNPEFRMKLKKKLLSKLIGSSRFLHLEYTNIEKRSTAFEVAGIHSTLAFSVIATFFRFLIAFMASGIPVSPVNLRFTE